MPRPRKNESPLRLHRRFFSRGLRNNRDVVVWLPPGYGMIRGRRHPVVYFQDGQNIFDPATAFMGNAWHAGEHATDLIRAHRIVAPIMVGVYNTGTNRLNEYAPTAAEVGGEGEKTRSAGDGKRYARFLVQELKPFIDAHYLTRPGPRDTGVIGSSMGGLISLYLALWHPRVFGHIAALSPSIWWDHRVAFQDFAKLRKKPDVRLWIDMGTAEPGWEGIQLFRDTLVGKGWKVGEDLAYREVPGGEHSEHAWSARVGDVLEWMFPLRRTSTNSRAAPTRPASQSPKT